MHCVSNILVLCIKNKKLDIPQARDDRPVSNISVTEARRQLRQLQEQTVLSRSKMGCLRQLWPEVEQALASGHSYNSLCEWLASLGIRYKRQTLYDAVWKIRRSKRSDVGG